MTHSKLTGENKIHLTARMGVLEIISHQISEFTMRHRVVPTKITVAASLATPISQEFIKLYGMPAELAVAWPIYINWVPINRSKALDDQGYFLLLSNDEHTEVL